MNSCLVCGSSLKKSSRKYCSNKCEATDKYNVYVSKWKAGIVDGSRGILAKNLSAHIKRYLKHKFGEKCSLCGWSIRHSHTGTVPLEVDHINGDSSDNREDNLRLVCPNCHSLSNNFRNLNKGRGRPWRTAKYLKHAPNTDTTSLNT